MKDYNTNMQQFSIKDLESYTGIKAHTIRIWEQRYGLLKPTRTESNIRKYSDNELKTLLNISLLNSRGHKISEIASMSDEAILALISQYSNSSQNDDTVISSLKLSMLNFDEKLFNDIVEHRIASHGLEHTFINILAPFLKEIGFLWLTNSICPAQEHFVSNLIKQKIYVGIDQIDINQIKHPEKTFVLYLPELEFHEISLLMLNLTLRSRGYKTIFLGQSVPIEDLIQLYQRLGDVHFISLFTTQPPQVLLSTYIGKIVSAFADTNCVFHLTGGIVQGMKSPELGLFCVYPDLSDLLQKVTV